MIAVLQDYRRISHVTMLLRGARSGARVAWLAAFLALALLAGAGIEALRHELDLVLFARIAVGLAGLWLAVVWATMFVPGSVLLNSAANARLLPRQRRRLMQMAALGWLLCMLACAAVVGAWGALPLAGFYLIGLPLMLAGHRPALGLLMATCGWPMMSHGVLSHSVVEAAASRPVVLALTVALLPAGAYALRLMYPAGGDRHLDGREEQLKRIQRQTTRAGAGVSETSGFGVRRVYGLALRRDCRQGDPGTMLMHALGPVAHWSAWLGGIVAIFVIGGGLHIALLRVDTDTVHAFVHGVAGAGLASLVMVVLFSTAQIGQQMRRMRGEQALLRLTPLAGDSALLNRRLATRLLARALGTWGALTAAILLAAWLIGGDRALMLREFALCCLAGQVAMMGLLGDYAFDAGWNLMLGLRAALVAAAEAGLALALGWLAGTSAWPWLVLVAVAVAALLVRRDWRRMLAAPVAFPAGRLA